jgi:hypothetical protein
MLPHTFCKIRGYRKYNLKKLHSNFISQCTMFTYNLHTNTLHQKEKKKKERKKKTFPSNISSLCQHHAAVIFLNLNKWVKTYNISRFVDIIAGNDFLGVCDPKAWILFFVVMVLWVFFFNFCKHSCKLCITTQDTSP